MVGTEIMRKLEQMKNILMLASWAKLNRIYTSSTVGKWSNYYY